VNNTEFVIGIVKEYLSTLALASPFPLKFNGDMFYDEQIKQLI